MGDNMKLLKFVLDVDEAPVVVCNCEHIVVYMNSAAINRYHTDITGRNIKECHNKDSADKIDRIVEWFRKSPENNKVHTYYNEKENKDVYMIALRDEAGNLAGYYEKHEYRTRDEDGFYIMGERT